MFKIVLPNQNNESEVMEGSGEGVWQDTRGVRGGGEEEDESGGVKPGARDEAEDPGAVADAMTKWHGMGLGSGEKGTEDSKGLGIPDEEKDEDHPIKLDGAGGANRGQEDEEAQESQH